MQVHGSRADVVGNGYVLSEFFNTASFGGTRDSAESTTFKKKSKTHVPGMKDASMSFGGFWEGEQDAADDILFAALGANQGVFSYFPASADAAGGLAYSLVAFETAYDVTSPVGGMCGVSAAMAAGEGDGIERGVVAHPMLQENAAGSGVTVDGLAASPNGGSLVLHVLNANALVMFLQDSADGVTWADLPGNLAPANGRSSLRLGINGAIRRYTRVRWTGTGQFLAVTNRK